MRKLTRFALTEGTQLKEKRGGSVYAVCKSKQVGRWRLRPVDGGEILDLRLNGINERFEKL